jgi:nucleotide-binding universal stress UspA family protein
MDSLINRVLVYIDGSEESVTAARYAICLSKVINAEFMALSIVNKRALDDLVKSRIFLKSEEEEYTAHIERDADRHLQYIKHLALQKGVAVETIKKHGTPCFEIRDEIEKRKIDLLVIGELPSIHSRRDEFFNETERAMRSVHCSVLIVKDEERVGQLYDAL